MIYLLLIVFLVILGGCIVLLFSSYENKKKYFWGIAGLLALTIEVSVLVQIIKVVFGIFIPLAVLLPFGIAGFVLGIYQSKVKFLRKKSVEWTIYLFLILQIVVIIIIASTNSQLKNTYKKCLNESHYPFTKRARLCSIDIIFK